MNDLTSIIHFMVDTMSRFIRVLSFSLVGQLILGAIMFSVIMYLISTILKNSSKK